MKIADIHIIQQQLTNIMNIINKENYNLSTAINKCVNKITPIIDSEQKRMEEDEIKINSPQIVILQSSRYDYLEGKLVKLLNEKLQDLVLRGYSIIDYGMLFKDDSTIAFYIKYTS